jgi:acylphosphatase
VAVLVARRFVITGLVQGVGFRFFVENAARAEGLSGWVQNQRDGSVEVVAEGDREAVGRFEMKLRRGPGRARIERVVADDEAPSGRDGGFWIR